MTPCNLGLRPGLGRCFHVYRKCLRIFTKRDNTQNEGSKSKSCFRSSISDWWNKRSTVETGENNCLLSHFSIHLKNSQYCINLIKMNLFENSDDEWNRESSVEKFLGNQTLSWWNNYCKSIVIIVHFTLEGFSGN